MQRLSLFLAALTVSTFGTVASATPTNSTANHIVSLGGDVTEIIYALGAQSKLACVDQTSLYPEAARKLPQVGYVRTLSAEGILACKPDLVLATQSAGPQAALDQLAASHIRIVRVSAEETPDAVLQKISTVAGALGQTAEGQKLQATFRATLARTSVDLAKIKDHPRAIFLMAHGPGGAMAAGSGTAAHAMLTLAHAENAASAFHGYKPLTAESAVALAPDVIVIDDISLKSLGGMTAFKARPEIALTPAAKNGRIATVDTMYILGFGPRTPAAIADLAKAVHAKP